MEVACMKQGLMRRRIARCVALFYVLFVVLSDMAGTGASFGAIRTKAAEYAQVGNYAQLTGDADGVSYPARVAVTAKATGANALEFSIAKTSDNSSTLGRYEIYSVSLNGGAPLYSKGLYSGQTETGLYYDNTAKKWIFVGTTSASKVKVALTHSLFANVNTITNSTTIYDADYSFSPVVGKQYTAAQLSSKLNTSDYCSVQYYDYDGKISSGSVAYRGQILYQYNGKINGSDSFYAYLGGTPFTPSGCKDASSIIISKENEPKITLGRKPGTNEFFCEASNGTLTAADIYISKYMGKICVDSYDYKLYYNYLKK